MLFRGGLFGFGGVWLFSSLRLIRRNFHCILYSYNVDCSEYFLNVVFENVEVVFEACHGKGEGGIFGTGNNNNEEVCILS